MRGPLLLLLTGTSLVLTAQVRSDRPVVLDGVTNGDRAVQGVKDPTSANEAMNANTLQDGGYAYAEVTSDTWQADVQPAVTQLSAGTRVLLHVATSNVGPVTLSVNGLAPAPVVKDNDQPLAAGDVEAGTTAGVVYDGNKFQLISARRIDRKPCPSGTVAVNELYCIEMVEHDTLEFPDAANVCGGLGMKLCSWGQFYVACTKAGQLGITDMVGNWEWTDDAGNSDSELRVVGQSSCTQASVTVGWNLTTYNFRCCFRR